ncbi:hypothetical protein EYC98_17740 [Halieaceae bacterium IMCC14734]|uniref:Cyclic GMP-AMP synthase n=1 Tax=Candidatus Litorirhabdus singularis TaxID=2518993 RepID=A0ABT3TK74_9GAMM|nr:CBASS cGAMP synthase [Candidatus Litorirhabdus singularis]MCX2982708.1 hypothetical protein [Candidatus Litorirhabdus singularis]
MPKYDVSDLLVKRFQSDRFINELDVDDSQLALMKDARTKVRNTLKSAFTRAKSNDEYLCRMEETDRQVFQNIEPRFWPQGSFAYGTQNVPAQIPPQQLDLDDGVYLPLEAMRDRPIVNKEIFFSIVDEALKELAREQGWRFIEKNTCARLEISHDIHIDVPLYAIPVEKFDDLQKAAGRSTLKRSVLNESDDLSLRRMLAGEKVYLALRDTGHWVESDPIQIQAWFENEQIVFGERLTNVCRYLKAWRDNTWPSGGPTSIALMICTWEVFRDSDREFYSDSDALLQVVKALPEKLSVDVRNPVSEKEIIFPRNVSPEQIAEIIRAANQLSTDVVGALQQASSPIQVVDIFRLYWGDRFPRRPDWVSLAGAIAAAVVTSTPIDAQPEPEIGTMRSGHRSG